jgi:hypothetical protein
MTDRKRSTGRIPSFRLAVLMVLGATLSCAAPLEESPEGSEAELETLAAATLLVVDDHYAASGYAGDGATGGVVERACPRRAGGQRGRCHAFTWTPGGAGWAGVFWQSPANNWGGSGGFAVPPGAVTVSFQAWGAAGGETVSFGAGLNGQDSFHLAPQAITLGREPQRYTLSLAGVNYGTDVVSAFVWIMSGSGGARTFYVDDVVWEGPDVPDPVDSLVVDDNYAPSGYAGDGAFGGVVERTCPRRGGAQRGRCHAFTWTPGPARWATVYWQSPANNWGSQPGYPMPRGARSISFYAWGERGGEAVSFGAGMDGQDSFKIASPHITLGTEPRRYTLTLSDVNYGSDVISAFMWSMNASSGAAQTFYVDDIAWDTAESPDLGVPWPPGPGAGGVSVRVRNLCGFPLWVDGAGAEASLPRVAVPSGQIHNYDVPRRWTSARINAYSSAGEARPIEKAEMTFYTDGGGNPHVAYNVTYVDWLGLPMEITSRGGMCNRASHSTGCSARQATILSGCPDGALRSGDRCMSPRSFCLDGDRNHPLCHELDGAIASCPSCPRGTTTEAYACSGPYAEAPRMCAALNRGMTHAPDDPDQTKYYRTGAYNRYAKWVHQVCPGIYAFSYDDWLSHGGFRDCVGGTEVRITFCPGG